MTTAEHQEYPKYMTHPMHQPSKMEKIQTVYPGGKVVEDTKGTAERFPPVMVNNADQEGIHAAQGYTAAGKSDPATFKRLVQAGASSPGGGTYTPAEFPKWVNGVLCLDEAQEKAAAGHHPVVVQDAEEPRPEAATMEAAPAEPDPRDKLIADQLDTMFKMSAIIEEMRAKLDAMGQGAPPAAQEAQQAAPTPLPVTQTPDLTRHRGRPRKAAQ